MNRFFQAIVRRPGTNFAQGLTSSRLGPPDFARASAQHAAYCAALQKCGLDLTLLAADPRYPDGCFVEDTAVLTERVAVITRPGDPTRRGEAACIAAELSSEQPVETIAAPGTLDGGDVLRVEDHFYIGQSQRTNAAGAEQLARILTHHGYTASTIPVRTVLHLKTGVTYLGDGTFITTAEFAERFAEYDPIEVGPEEAYAANCLRVNDRVLVPAGFPMAHRQLAERGLELIFIEMSEYEKMDGGLTCLSLLY
jgi:dimethylargininase